ncbi:MAG: flagellar biosynthesis protein FlgF [Halioglobus sp.]|nr:flagellar biosynthesis protein FlgF [Halioglobus sp.]|tara:strand:+ start:863 stop:1603 length:741 start_codon:yes stop_codon:yes gene_type:complete
MDHLVYIAASGANDVLLAQAVNANNLANASTAGFRADLISASSAYMDGPGLESRSYATSNDIGIDFDPGVINATGRDLDVAINGKGWISVIGAGGGEGLSRRGDLRVTSLGRLVDGAGNAVVGNSGPIAIPPFSEISIGKDGTISIVPLGENPTTLAVVDRIKLSNPPQGELVKGDDGLVRMRNGQEPVADAGVSLIAGSLESSNVDTVGAMVYMIEIARQFEQHTRMISVADELDTASSQLMKLS